MLGMHPKVRASWRGGGQEGSIPLVEPDTEILRVCSGENVWPAIAVEIVNGQTVSLRIGEVLVGPHTGPLPIVPPYRGLPSSGKEGIQVAIVVQVG